MAMTEEERKEWEVLGLYGWEAKSQQMMEERRERQREAVRKYYSKPGNKSKQKCTQLRRIYGITLEEWQEIFKAQGSCCAICKCAESERPWDTDHCHATGKVRGILCHTCNKALGLFKDNVEALQNAIAYLTRNKGE